MNDVNIRAFITRMPRFVTVRSGFIPNREKLAPRRVNVTPDGRTPINCARPTTEKKKKTKLMKTRNKLAMLGALGALTSAAVFAQTPAGEDSPPLGPPRGRPGMDRPSPEAHRQVLLEKYDANKDGKLDDKELSALGKDVFEGNLPPPGRGHSGPGFGPPSPGHAGEPGFGPPRPGGPPGDFQRGFGPGGPRDGAGPRPPRDRMRDGSHFDREGGPERPSFGPAPHGFGRPDSEQGRKMLEERRRDFLKRYDANGDGKLDAAEREAIGKDIEDGKLPSPPPLPQRPDTR